MKLFSFVRPPRRLLSLTVTRGTRVSLSISLIFRVVKTVLYEIYQEVVMHISGTNNIHMHSRRSETSNLISYSLRKCCSKLWIGIKQNWMSTCMTQDDIQYLYFLISSRPIFSNFSFSSYFRLETVMSITWFSLYRNEMTNKVISFICRESHREKSRFIIGEEANKIIRLLTFLF